ncbi:ATPase with chaperone activity [Limnohabitans sp. Rim8]|uniref:ATPase with chaperone activity n=1 Tax=Limnohabitans sp. Rim8 TaxID=1100718 RepID=UPI0025E245C9|nr:ATPase with chaperone activity [Limnohabitans sp. Rim8]
MSDDNQLYLPESFKVLYVPHGKIKPSIGLSEMAERYELCEDLANLLTKKAANMQFTLGITEELVLAQCELGLLAEPSVVSPLEARWVVCRLAELLNWPMGQLLQSPAGQGD